MQNVNKLLAALAACKHVTVAKVSDTLHSVEVDLGTGWAGDYAGGYWGDVSITDDALTFTTTIATGEDCWDTESEYCFYEGIVRLHYTDYENAGLAYTSELENAINAAVEQRTNGILLTDGSEQGMQGMDSADDCYLSLDVDTVEQYAAQQITAA